MQSDSGSNDNRRRYPRIVIPQGKTDLQKLIGIDARVLSGERVPILDLSYSGAALLRAENQDPGKIGSALKMDFVFEGNIYKPVSAELVRTTDSAMGVRFREMSPETRLELDRYMNDKMMGLNIRQVRTELLSARDRRYDLSYWYHGPKDTNIFLWQKNGALTKAVVEIDYQVIEIENDEIAFGQTQPETEFYKDGYSAYLDVPSDNNVQYSPMDIAKRVINVISQIPQKSKELEWLLDLMIRKASS